ncbi:hypothetical protein [Neptuniibacter sp. QD37_11]|uniref:hypothetical protein n=1 Tax=Neptuniibacter sp. QD37_11 TaxID=3398209 RepID=UPI0039F4C457
MLVDWKELEDKEHVLAWLLVDAMSEVGMEKFGKFDSSKLDVEMKVNGIEVPVLSAMEHLQTQLSSIKEAGRKEGLADARQLLQDNIDQLLAIEE